MTHQLESQHLSPMPQATRAESSADSIWLAESAPEDFLREVEGFLRESPDAPELKTGDTLTEG